MRRLVLLVCLFSALLPGTASAWTRAPGLTDVEAVAPAGAPGELVALARDHPRVDVEGLTVRSLDASGDVVAAQQLDPGRAWPVGVAGLPGGGAVAVWQSEGPSGSAIRVARRPAGAERFTADEPLADRYGGLLATSPSGTHLALLLEDGRGGQWLAEAGGTGAFGAPQRLPLADRGSPWTTGLAVDDGGDVVLSAWPDDRAIVVLTRDGADGRWQTATLPLSPPPGPNGAVGPPRVGLDAAGTAVVVWPGGGATPDGPELVGALRPRGGTFGLPQGLGLTADSAGPQLVVTAPGEVLVTAHYDDPAHGGSGLGVVGGSTVAGRFGPARLLSSAVFSGSAVLAANARGDAVVTWPSGGGHAVRRRPALGRFGPLESVSAPDDPTGTSASARASVDPFGETTLLASTSDGLFAAHTTGLRDGRGDPQAPAVVLPGPEWLPELVAPAPAGSPPGQADLADPDGTFVTPQAASGITTLAGTDPPAEVVVRLVTVPGMTGRPRVAVRLSCDRACGVVLAGTVTAPSGRRYALPTVPVWVDRPARLSVGLPLTPAAREALAPQTAPRAVPRAAAARVRGRRFRVRVSATAFDGRATRHLSTSRTFRRR